MNNWIWYPHSGDMLALSKDFPGLSPPRGVHFRGDEMGRLAGFVGGSFIGFVSFRWACQRWMEA